MSLSQIHTPIYIQKYSFQIYKITKKRIKKYKLRNYRNITCRFTEIQVNVIQKYKIPI